MSFACYQGRAEAPPEFGRALHGRSHGVGKRSAERGPRSEEHTSELQSLMRISYAVFCLKKKKIKHNIAHYFNQCQQAQDNSTKELTIRQPQLITQHLTSTH